MLCYLGIEQKQLIQLTVKGERVCALTPHAHPHGIICGFLPPPPRSLQNNSSPPSSLMEIWHFILKMYFEKANERWLKYFEKSK